MSLGNSARFKIFKRDSFTCQYCGRHPPDAILEVDHIMPASKGGTDDSINLVTSCFECNRGKRDSLLSDKPKPLREVQEIENEKFKQFDAYNSFLRQKRKKDESWIKEISDIYIRLIGEDPKIYRMPEEMEMSCRTFLKKLPCEKIIEALFITNAKRGLKSNYDKKYFYGTCWGMIKRPEDSK